MAMQGTWVNVTNDYHGTSARVRSGALSVATIRRVRRVLCPSETYVCACECNADALRERGPQADAVIETGNMGAVAVHSAYALKAAKRQAEARAQVATRKCPTCGGGIHRNLSMAGWWQCDRLGAETHRIDKTGPACNWQVFTE